ncbi:DUF4209 domain-containing protein [Pandoraea terrigena]|uniref:Uncharacterized protein n=1 Tax=Pandoraea terrigena TaxID=2508292 RepID=A0A5E4WAI3_9BURK|nr:DUF4209 domain-containing protein [Pandoraea terrigena]VVE20115.1 hypothetical protein PTE31013_03115 [Pandoraea terrigena]
MTTDTANPDEPLSAADFRATAYEAVLADGSDETCMMASCRLYAAAEAAREAGDARTSRVLKLLANATSMMLVAEDKSHPFRHSMQFGDRRSTAPDDFSEHEIALFAEVAPEVANSHLRARLADLVWLHPRKFGVKYAHLAIDSYREIPPSDESWFASGREYWARALTLAMSIGSGAGPRIGEIEASLISAIFANGDRGYVPLQIAAILLKAGAGRGSAGDIATRMEALARTHAASLMYHEAIAYFEAAATWHARSAARDKSVEMVVAGADCWEMQGDSKGAGLASLNFYENAIKVFRTVPGPSRVQYTVDARIESLHAKVRQAGQAAAVHMQTVKTSPIDISELIRQAVEKVTNKQPLEVLAAFSQLYRGARVERIRAVAQSNLDKSIFRQIMGSVVMSAQGNTVARQPAAGGSLDAADAALRSQMVRDFQIVVGLTATAEIKPALEVIRSQHVFTVWDFEEVCRYSPFVPPDRVDLLAEGLYAGYCGDMVHAMHVLVPQVENIVRFHLQHAGAITTTTSPDGIVMENGMSTLVKLPQMVTVFGEDFTFELSALFCDQNGPNLRNEIAHGLMSKAACESDACIYAWWLIYARMFRNFWTAQQRVAQMEVPGKTGSSAT